MSAPASDADRAAAEPEPEDGARLMPAGAPTGAAKRRLLAIDAFRGLVLAFMLVTPTGGEPDTYPLLRHAAWNGWTFSDLIFPAFLVTSGASLAFLLRPPLKQGTVLRLVKRVVALVVLGLLYNGFGAPADLSVLRFTGVLQLIGLSGGLAATVVLMTRRGDGADRRAVLAAVAVGVVALYGIGIAALDERCRGVVECNPFHGTDVGVLGAAHLYRQGTVRYDPEGLAVVVAASGLVLAGYLTGQFLRERGATLRTAGALLAGGVALVLLALVVDQVQPINKRLHTPAFSLLSAGVAVAGISAFAAMFDTVVARWGPAADRARAVVTFPLTVLGRNALVVYLGERILTTVAGQTRMANGGTLQDWLLANWVPFDGGAAYLGYGFLVLAAILVVTVFMHLMRWRIAL